MKTAHGPLSLNSLPFRLRVYDSPFGLRFILSLLLVAVGTPSRSKPLMRGWWWSCDLAIKDPSARDLNQAFGNGSRVVVVVGTWWLW